MLRPGAATRFLHVTESCKTNYKHWPINNLTFTFMISLDPVGSVRNLGGRGGGGCLFVSF